MNGTPRLHAAYPSTPRTDQKRPSQYGGGSGGLGSASKLQDMPSGTARGKDDFSTPLIPFDVIDAPSQRLYVLAFYFGLMAWRFYDYWRLVADDVDSLWLFMKWAAIDGAFLYGLPAMRVPWLEWSTSTTTIPLEAWLIAFTRILYDRELSVSEHRVKRADLLHSSSLIQGKQTIHILPEGSAVLNPLQTSFCLDNSKTSIQLPIRINQTDPILIELLRFDLDSNENETVTISAGQIKKLKKIADKELPKGDLVSPRFLRFPVKRTGLYRLQKVIDKSKLEVQRRLSDTLVVSCPKAALKSVGANKCRGELSNFVLEVEGTPPLKIKYSRSVNREDRGFSFQSIQPENLISPLIRQRTSGALITQSNTDVSWAQSQRISVPLNESLSTSGHWLYSIDEVHDACGNVANYSRRHEDSDRFSPKDSHLEQVFAVHERPLVALDGCDSQHPLKVAKGHSARLPLKFTSSGRAGKADASFTVSYLFTPLEQLAANGEHSADARMLDFVLPKGHDQPEIQQPGLYTLKSVTSEYCSGDILEPTSCLLYNPPEPDLSLTSEKIYDKCAGNSIGLLVDLDLIGTPPFRVYYNEVRAKDRQVFHRQKDFDRLRGQLELKPEEAGHYTYRFLGVGDSVYPSHSLQAKGLDLEQDVKPPASAHFIGGDYKKQACIEEPVSFDLRLQGEGPWTLEYELVHGGRRRKHTIPNIESEYYTITTEKLVDGGEYSLALASVTDKSGCKIFLDQEAKIDVRRQRPKVSFGQLESKRSALILEGKRVSLPLRLTGEPPWSLQYRNLNDSTARVLEKKVQYKNDVIEVKDQGTYEIVDVQDAVCPGTVDHSGNIFDVAWIPRPSISVSESPVLQRVGNKYVKSEVCEGEDDDFEVNLSGTPPYHIKYEQHLKPERGSASLNRKEFTAGLGIASIRMETSQAGTCEYRFYELGDHLYDHDSKKHAPLVVQQRVNARPSARFSNPGKTYSYCKEEEAGDEVIPITLSGTPPFSIEVSIKHHGSPKPQVISVPNIDSNRYDFRIPHRVLALGNHIVSMRKVRDARGCQRKMETDPPRVQVIVSDVPTISPIESRVDYCVGDRISYTLSGTQPFNVFYNFQGLDRKATSTSTTFRRVADKPGNFTITAIGDGASTCKARTEITKIIHQMPSVRMSKGRDAVVDIHEGGEAEITFDFGGTPPFEFTYTRSTTPRKGKRSQVLETKHDISYEHSKTVRASEEGTYEVIAIKDKFCAYSTWKAEGGKRGALGGGGGGQGLLMF
ncbi:MAG: hypothetical protein M1819_003083 [Sarea resinae]|nr:MAG: hypothetical protein M1819_003083 [Sarea resinae]